MRGVKSLLMRSECEVRRQGGGAAVAVLWLCRKVVTRRTEGTLVSVTAPLSMMDDHRRRHTDTRQI